MNTIKDFLNAILNLLLFPFRFMIVLVNEIEYKFNRFKQYLYEYKIKKQNQKAIDELKCTIIGHDVTKVNQILHVFILLATTGLQFISFFTTFAGTNYYFGNITQPKFLGPVIITCVIQFSLLFLSNTIVHNEKTNKGSKGMLAFFLFVSIMFSYAGMIHTIVPPHKEMKTNYEDFITKYDEIYHIYQSQFNVDEDVSTLVASKVNELQQILKNQIATTKAQLDATPKYSSTSSSSNTTTNIQGETTTTNSSSSTINSEWTKQNNTYNMLLNVQKELTNQYKKVKDNLSQATNLSSENEQINALKTLENADTFITSFNYTVDTLNQFQTIDLTPISNFETIYYQIKTNHTMKENRCLTYEQIELQVQQALNIPVSNSNLEYLSNIANIIDEEITSYEKTPLYLEEDLSSYNIDKQKLLELKEASLKAKTIQDFNMLAYGYLNPTHSLFSKAIITFIFAIFIDMTTFLMPYFMEKTNKNVLFMNKKKDILNEVELLTQLLESFCLHNQDIMTSSNNMKQDLCELIGLFELSSNQAIEDGYSLKCDQDALNQYVENKRHLMGFVIFVLNRQYLYKDETLIYNEENKVYLRTKFALWLQNVTTSLSKFIKNQSEGMNHVE